MEIGYTRSGGYAQFDNESQSPTTVNLSSRIDMFVISVIDFTKLGSSSQIGSGSTLRSIAGTSTTLGADDDSEDSNFNFTGADFFHWDLPELSVSDSGYMGDLGQFLGTDGFSVEMDGLQSESLTGVSGAKKSTSPSSLSGFVTITYDYTVTAVPEIGSLILGPLGLAALIIVRRRR